MICASIDSSDKNKKSQHLENRCVSNSMLRECQGLMSLCGSIEECQNHLKKGSKNADLNL